MKFILLILIALLGLNLAALAQDNDKGDKGEKEVKVKDVPAAVTAAFAAKYPTMKVLEWEKEGDEYVAEFKKDGQEWAADFNAKGEWLETERELKFAMLPGAVKSAFRQGPYAKDKAKEVEEAETPKHPKCYKIEVMHEGKEVETGYAADGKILFTKTEE